MSMTHSAVLICPIAKRDDGNHLAWAMGWQPEPGVPGTQETFSVPLSASGSEPATHFGMHTWAGPEFLAVLDGATQGQLPEKNWAAARLTPQRVSSLLAEMLIRIVAGVDNAGANWDETLFVSGLKPIIPQLST